MVRSFWRPTVGKDPLDISGSFDSDSNSCCTWLRNLALWMCNMTCPMIPMIPMIPLIPTFRSSSQLVLASSMLSQIIPGTAGERGGGRRRRIGVEMIHGMTRRGRHMARCVSEHGGCFKISIFLGKMNEQPIFSMISHEILGVIIFSDKAIFTAPAATCII